jgi:hypothetical protein
MPPDLRRHCQRSAERADRPEAQRASIPLTTRQRWGHPALPVNHTVRLHGEMVWEASRPTASGATGTRRRDWGGGTIHVRLPIGQAADVPEPGTRLIPSSMGWPHLSLLKLAALPTAVPCGRLHTREVLWEWKLGYLADDAELLTSELLSNADAPRGALLYPRRSREELKGGSWA